MSDPREALFAWRSPESNNDSAQRGRAGGDQTVLGFAGSSSSTTCTRRKHSSRATPRRAPRYKGGACASRSPEGDRDCHEMRVVGDDNDDRAPTALPAGTDDRPATQPRRRGQHHHQQQRVDAAGAAEAASPTACSSGGRSFNSLTTNRSSPATPPFDPPMRRSSPRTETKTLFRGEEWESSPSGRSPPPVPAKPSTTTGVPPRATAGVDHEEGDQGKQESMHTPLWGSWELWCDGRQSRPAGADRQGGSTPTTAGQQQQQPRNMAEMNWLDEMRSVGVFDTAEGFWGISNCLKPPSALDAGIILYVLRKNIPPMWEHEANRRGGRWSIVIPASEARAADRLWDAVRLAAIGEMFPGDDTDICGVVVGRRKHSIRVSVWIRYANEPATRAAIGQYLKDLGQRHVVSPSPSSSSWTFQEHAEFFASPHSGTSPFSRSPIGAGPQSLPVSAAAYCAGALVVSERGSASSRQPYSPSGTTGDGRSRSLSPTQPPLLGPPLAVSSAGTSPVGSPILPLPPAPVGDGVAINRPSPLIGF